MQDMMEAVGMGESDRDDDEIGKTGEMEDLPEPCGGVRTPKGKECADAPACVLEEEQSLEGMGWLPKSQATAPPAVAQPGASKKELRS